MKKYIIIGFVIVIAAVIILSNKDCDNKESCADEHAIMQHICSGACNHGLDG